MEQQLAVVLAHYLIGEVAAVEPAGGTAGKCWRVTTDEGRFLVRRRGPRTSSREALEFDHGFRRHLLNQGVPTAAPLATRAGETWVRSGNRALEVYPFVEGSSFRGTLGERLDTARALARFHRAAASYPARGSYSPAPVQFALAAPAVGGSARLDDPALMLAAFRRIAPGTPEMNYAVEQAELLARAYAPATYEVLPRWLLHGDYHPGNLLYAATGAVAGIFDLDWACEHPRSRDLADLIYFFAARRDGRLEDASIESLTDASEPDLEVARQLLSGYHQELPLTPEEARAIPLALQARWLAIRLEGSAKVSTDRKTWFVTRDLELPLTWAERHAEDLIAVCR